MKKKIVCVIPARLDSKRFPEKVLQFLRDKPILQWVYDAATGTEIFDEIVFAVDDARTKELLDSFGAKSYLTSKACVSGTQRLIELYERKEIEGDIFVNWQADEPFISKQMIEDLLQGAASKASIWTLKSKIKDMEEVNNPNVVKVVTSYAGEALYFSRSPIPFYRDGDSSHEYYKHVGLYAYTSKALDGLGKIESSVLEKAEKLEQLSFLEHGYSIYVGLTNEKSFGIDSPSDLLDAASFISKL